MDCRRTGLCGTARRLRHPVDRPSRRAGRAHRGATRHLCRGHHAAKARTSAPAPQQERHGRRLPLYRPGRPGMAAQPARGRCGLQPRVCGLPGLRVRHGQLHPLYPHQHPHCRGQRPVARGWGGRAALRGRGTLGGQPHHTSRPLAGHHVAVCRPTAAAHLQFAP